MLALILMIHKLRQPAVLPIDCEKCRNFVSTYTYSAIPTSGLTSRHHYIYWHRVLRYSTRTVTWSAWKGAYSCEPYISGDLSKSSPRYQCCKSLLPSSCATTEDTANFSGCRSNSSPVRSLSRRISCKTRSCVHERNNEKAKVFQKAVSHLWALWFLHVSAHC